MNKPLPLGLIRRYSQFLRNVGPFYTSVHVQSITPISEQAWAEFTRKCIIPAEPPFTLAQIGRVLHDTEDPLHPRQRAEWAKLLAPQVPR
ncbi:MAG: hypothetical protein JSS29_11070 [Proteobacteria bacterium]|nr:hypothetical protein [Pseudomonadota bacterium]